MCNNIEPLSPALWFQRIAVIAAGDLASSENSLRHASHLVQLAPISYRRIVGSIGSEDGFESLLDAGDLNSAARQLFGPSTTLLIESGSDGTAPRAVVACAILKRSVVGTGGSATAAMISAWANWILALRLEFGADFDGETVGRGDQPIAQCKSACPRAG